MLVGRLRQGKKLITINSKAMAYIKFEGENVLNVHAVMERTKALKHLQSIDAIAMVIYRCPKEPSSPDLKTVYLVNQIAN